MKQDANEATEGAKEDRLTERERLLGTVAKAFLDLYEGAERMAFGGAATECDLSPDGNLAQLAKKVAAQNQPNPDYDMMLKMAKKFGWEDPFLYPFPLRVFPQAVETLRGLVQWAARGDDRKLAGCAGEMENEVSTWCRKRGLAIEGKPDELRRMVAGRLAELCKTCSAVAFLKNSGDIGSRIVFQQHKAEILSERAKTEDALHHAEQAEELRKEAAKKQREAELLAEERARLLSKLGPKIETAEAWAHTAATISARTERKVAAVHSTMERTGIELVRFWNWIKGLKDWPGKLLSDKNRMNYSLMWPLVDQLVCAGKSVEVACSETLQNCGYKNADARMLENFIRAYYKREEKRHKGE